MKYWQFKKRFVKTHAILARFFYFQPTVPSKKKPKVNKKPPPKIVVEDEESDNQAEATNEHIPEPLGNQLAKNDEPSDNIEDYRFLVNWVPKLKGKKMIVEGDLYDFT